MSNVQRLACLLSVVLILAIWVFALWMLLMWSLFCGCKRNLSSCYARLFTFSPFGGNKGDAAVVGCRLFISFFPPIYERAHPHTCRDWVLWFKIVLAIKCESCDLNTPFITGDIEFVCVCVFICGWMMSTHMGESHPLCWGCQLECKFFWRHFTAKPRNET